MKQVTIGTCQDCKACGKVSPEGAIEDDYLLVCHHPKTFGIESGDDFPDSIHEVVGDQVMFFVGPEFGCIHWERKIV